MAHSGRAPTLQPHLEILGVTPSILADIARECQRAIGARSRCQPTLAFTADSHRNYIPETETQRVLSAYVTVCEQHHNCFLRPSAVERLEDLGSYFESVVGIVCTSTHT